MEDIVKLGTLIDTAFQCREDIRTLEEQKKELTTTLNELEVQILERLDEVGVTTARAAEASVTITEQMVPQIDDFDAALDWIGNEFEERKHLLFRRITSGSFKELIDMGELVPGVSPYTKRKVSLRKLPS